LVRVDIIAETPLHRDGLERLLSEASQLDVVGSCCSYENPLALVRRSNPDLVVLDVDLSVGRQVAREILKERGRPRTLALLAVEKEQEVVAWAEIGISGFLSKDASANELVETIHRVANGRFVCSPLIMGALLRRMATLSVAATPAACEGPPKLTPRETQVAILIEDGLSNKEIARNLSIKLPTVKNHVHNILQKLGLDRRMAAAAWIRQNQTGLYLN
jgi:DNA-binding NarL/FixJ family response regulator